MHIGIQAGEGPLETAVWLRRRRIRGDGVEDVGE